MRIDRLTSKLQMALSDAQSIAVGRDHNFIEPVHVLSAMVEDSSGSIKPLLAQAGVNVGQLKDSQVACLAAGSATKSVVDVSVDGSIQKRCSQPEAEQVRARRGEAKREFRGQVIQL